VEAVVLLSGRVAATWRTAGGGTLRVDLRPARKLTKAEMKLIEREFMRLASWQGAADVALTVDG
jgi:hypothetical protein